MSSTANGRAFQILREYSLFLIGGSITAIVWANTALESYLSFINTSWGNLVIWGQPVAHHGISVHFLVNELFMVFFFGIAMKEVMEAEIKIRVQGKSALPEDCLEEIRQPDNISKLRRASDPPGPGNPFIISYQ